jgi:hypothetical protein
MENRNELLKVEALRIMEASESSGIPIRLLGGVAVYLSSPCTRSAPFAREIYDLDFVVPKKKAYPLEKLLAKIGFTGNREFNSIHGETRLLFYSELAEVDVFVGAFEQCHNMNLEKLINTCKVSIPLAALLLTKLQIVQINQKDILDILAILYDHDVQMDGNPNEIISLNELNAIWCDDWGWYTTCMDNLDKIHTFVEEKFSDADQKKLNTKIGLIQANAESTKKTLKWTLRSKVGRKLPWYELPEEK